MFKTYLLYSSTLPLGFNSCQILSEHNEAELVRKLYSISDKIDRELKSSYGIMKNNLEIKLPFTKLLKSRNHD